MNALISLSTSSEEQKRRIKCGEGKTSSWVFYSLKKKTNNNNMDAVSTLLKLDSFLLRLTALIESLGGSQWSWSTMAHEGKPICFVSNRKAFRKIACKRKK